MPQPANTGPEQSATSSAPQKPENPGGGGNGNGNGGGNQSENPKPTTVPPVKPTPTEAPAPQKPEDSPPADANQGQQDASEAERKAKEKAAEEAKEKAEKEEEERRKKEEEAKEKAEEAEEKKREEEEKKKKEEERKAKEAAEAAKKAAEEAAAAAAAANSNPPVNTVQREITTNSAPQNQPAAPPVVPQTPATPQQPDTSTFRRPGIIHMPVTPPETPISSSRHQPNNTDQTQPPPIPSGPAPVQQQPVPNQPETGGPSQQPQGDSVVNSNFSALESDASSSASEGNKTAAVVGSVIGVLIFVIALALFVKYKMPKDPQRDEEKSHAPGKENVMRVFNKLKAAVNIPMKMPFNQQQQQQQPFQKQNQHQNQEKTRKSAASTPRRDYDSLMTDFVPLSNSMIPPPPLLSRTSPQKSLPLRSASPALPPLPVNRDNSGISLTSFNSGQQPMAHMPLHNIDMPMYLPISPGGSLPMPGHILELSPGGASLGDTPIFQPSSQQPSFLPQMNDEAIAVRILSPGEQIGLRKPSVPEIQTASTDAGGFGSFVQGWSGSETVNNYGCDTYYGCDTFMGADPVLEVRESIMSGSQGKRSTTTSEFSMVQVKNKK